ncbi:BRISC complex subunit Abraxas 2-like isoform X2 [Liolophura sinensis]|uniref:BRISC complex subunit Abraxas 2-like isoform X2 n=1 Tax=Liolophura sinensis TaxID=3198878 RepID=UPI0031586145
MFHFQQPVKLRARDPLEGFLLGQIVSHVKDTITDSQISGCKVETVTNIYSFIPCPYSATFYDRHGEILRPKLDALLQGRTKELVGWYKFRRNSSPRVSLKEHSLHRKLLKFMSPGQHEHFLFCLCTASTTTNCSTHAFDHSFQVYVRGVFNPVSLSISNLGDSIQNEYKQRNNLTVNPTAGVYSSLVSKFIPEFTDENGQVHEVNKMHLLAEKLQSQLQLLCSVVNDSEKQLQGLESELAGIKSRLDNKKEKERLKQPLPPSPIETPESFLPVDMDTAGPPPYPNREQKPSVHVQSLFIPEEDSGGISLPPVTHQGAVLTGEILKPDKVPDALPGVTEAGDIFLKSKDDTERELNDSQEDNSDVVHPVMVRTSSLPNKQSGVKSGQPADHFSFIDSVLKEAKSSTPSRTASVKLSDNGKKARSFDDSKLSSHSNTAPPKPPRTFDVGDDKTVVDVTSNDLNSSLADKNDPSTIDRNDKLRCKPVQRTRSRALNRSKSNDSPVNSGNASASDVVCAKGKNSGQAEAKTSGMQPALVSQDSANPVQKVAVSTKRTRTRAQVQAERAAAAKSAITPVSGGNAGSSADPPTNLNSLATKKTSSGGDGASDSTNDTVNIGLKPAVKLTSSEVSSH